MTTSNVSIRDIAKACEVSAQTVSRILGGKTGNHRPKTVEKVQRTAAEMGYRRNIPAKSIFTGKTQMVGVMVYESDGFFADMLRGIHDALVNADYVPALILPNSQNSLREGVHRLLDRRVDGIIMEPFVRPFDVYHKFLDIDVPTVLVDDEVSGGGPDMDFVGTDDLLGGRMVADHLLSLGHRRLGYLHLFGETEGFEESPLGLRYKGFFSAFQGRGDVSCIRMNDTSDLKRGYEGALELLDRPDRPTAVFACMDHLAEGVYAAAKALKLRIPEDLSVVGFADLEFARFMDPPLTTIRQFPYEIGTRAVEMLLKRINGVPIPVGKNKIRLTPEMILRHSTAPLAEV